MSSLDIRDSSVSPNIDSTKDTEVTATIPLDDSNQRRISKKISMTFQFRHSGFGAPILAFQFRRPHFCAKVLAPRFNGLS